ncbi:MAG: DUF4350 domain-containing protein [Candidatus Thermoplasmatota archaeon]|nr:DUF4350 domain-containing protein [Candidatus Thermoplasmatota archaeon]
MIEQVRTAYRYFLIMGIGVVLFLFSIMVPILSSDADFSIYNTSWNGCSDLGRDVYRTGSFLPTIDISSSSEERVVHNSFNELEVTSSPGDTTIIIIGPDMEFTADEGRYVNDFLGKGGRLLLADDVGTGNSLLGYLNTSSRISNDIMMDLSYMKKGEFAVTLDMAPHPITENLTHLLMNYPSTIIPGISAVSIINSSGTSWLDTIRNERIDPEETEGPFPILTIEDYGNGELLLLSEPSLLINQMKDQMDNGPFASDLINYISEGRKTIVIDESHRDLANPVQLANIFITDTSPGEKVGIMTAVIAIFIIVSSPLPKRTLSLIQKGTSRILSEKIEKKEKIDPIKEVMNRHPDWDRRTLEKIVTGIGAGT